MKRISLLSLYVRDQDAAIEFYRDKLGFLVAEDIPFGPMRWATLRLPDDDLAAITLKLARTDDEKALVGKQAGVRFHGEPKVEPYGTGVTLEDLYGNQIYLNQEVAEASQTEFHSQFFQD